jgi:hypothetical protein
MGEIYTFPVVKKLSPREAQSQMRILIKAVREEVCEGCKKRFAQFFKLNFPERPNFLEQNERLQVDMWLRANMPNCSLPQFYPSTV